MPEQQNKGYGYTPLLYVNTLRGIFVPFMWSFVAFMAWLFAYIYTDGYKNGHFDYDNPFTIPFIAGQYVITVVFFVIFFRSARDSFRANSINTFLQADDDGIVYIKDLAAYLKKPEVKTIKIVKYLIRKKNLVRINYNNEEKIILLSDRRVHETSFIGIHCPGCQAALKVRTNTESLCPVCGRKLFVPTVTVVDGNKDEKKS